MGFKLFQFTFKLETFFNTVQYSQYYSSLDAIPCIPNLAGIGPANFKNECAECPEMSLENYIVSESPKFNETN